MARVDTGMTFEEALALTGLTEEKPILELVEWANELRRRYHGDKVDLCSIVNAKSGACAEDCAFCAQSLHYQKLLETKVDIYGMKSADEILAYAKAAEAAGAHRFCIVTSGRDLSGRDFEIALEATRRIRMETSLEADASMGTLSREQALALKEAGLNRYHCNLETARSYFPQICTTHTWEDKVATIRAIKGAGIETCIGGILNMGESVRQRIEFAFELKELEPDSVPINFLNPRPGTPLGSRSLMEPLEVVKYLAIYRLIMPEPIIRMAGGRMENARDMQSTAMKAGVNGLLIGNLLTTPGPAIAKDMAMLKDLGFDV